MGLINIRDVRPFEANGANTTDTVINGIHYNLTALEAFNYTLYSNQTISNVSNCYLIFDDYQPAILPNGTMVNGTACSAPILPLKMRGKLSAGFAAIFGISIMFTLINLKKHGKSFLREDRRFRLVGRRWQWYWLLFVGACGMISCITGIDVDRNYIQDLAIILQSFFFLCMADAAVAAVWEGVRHWGSWEARQIVDSNPYGLSVDDRRDMSEFYMPLLFYTFTFMSFFLTAPRSWSRVPDQNDPWLQQNIARPASTDGRFKAGSIMLVGSFFVTIYCIYHNLHHYSRNAPGVTGFFRAFGSIPTRFYLLMTISAVRIGFGVAMAWNFDISIMKYDVNVVWPFALGYTPCILILIVMNVWGLMSKNEDQKLITQRIQRGQSADAEIGYTKKPSWWSKARGGGGGSDDDMARLRGHIAEANIHSNKPNTSRGHRSSVGSGMEMNKLAPKSPVDVNDGFESAGLGNALGTPYDDGLRARSRSRGANDELLTSIRNTDPMMSRLDRHDRETRSAGRAEPAREQSVSGTSVASSAITGTTIGENTRAQKVRSMLDI